MEKEHKQASARPSQSLSPTQSAMPPSFQLTSEPIQRQAAPNNDDPFEVPWNDTQMDQYPQLSGYGNGSNNRPLNSVDYIVLHSTGGSSTLSSVDAHFEVASDGTIYLANDPNNGCPHAGHRYQRQEGHEFHPYENMNARSQGIEFVNDYHTLQNQARSTQDAEKVQAMRDEIAGLDLAPQFKQSLLNLSDRDLVARMRGTSYVIYEDITAEQKQAAYEMYRNMQQDNPDAEFIAHEHVAPKKVGEGANIQEFLETIQAYNTKLGQLRAIAPEFWAYEQPDKGTLQEQAERAMSSTQFFAEFYAINARADRLLELFGAIDGKSTAELLPHLQPDGEGSSGMYSILGRFKRYAVKKEILSRDFEVEVSVTRSQDWYGGEDTFIQINGQPRGQTATIEDGGSHAFTFSNRLIRQSISGSNPQASQIEVFDSDDIGANDLLMDLNWNPMQNPAGVTSSNSNYSVSISFK